MSENNTIMSFRVLILVTTPKLSELATEYFKRKDLPIHYKLNAVGTAPSDILDILGIGTSEKSVILSMVRKDIADVILRELYVELMKAYKEGNEEKAEFLQNMVGYFSVTECQCYPVNAKYYVSLDGVNIGIHTRTRNPAELFDARKMEIEQMYAFTQAVKEKFNIQ